MIGRVNNEVTFYMLQQFSYSKIIRLFWNIKTVSPATEKFISANLHMQLLCVTHLMVIKSIENVFQITIYLYCTLDQVFLPMCQL